MTGMHVGAGVLPDLDIGLPRAPGSPIRRPSQTWHDGLGRLVARGGRHDGSWWMEWPGLGTFRFREEGPVTVQPIAPGLEEHLRDSFLRGVLPVAMLGRGYEALHASAVEGPCGVVALCATSGTGKSTLALALAAGGLAHWADDTVVYHLPDHRVVTVRLPCVPRIDDVARPPVRRADAEPAAGDTRPLARVYYLVRDDRLHPRQPVFAPVGPTMRFRRLLAHAHPFEMGPETRRRAFISTLLEVARGTAAWECRFAPSLEHLPSLARAVRHHMASVDA